MKFDSLSEIWKNKSLIIAISKTDLKLRYRSSVLGALWTFLEPLLILLILFVVFSSLLKNNISDYPLFLLLGITIFQFFSRSTSMAMESTLQKAGIISSIKISKIIFPVSASLTALYMFGFEFLILFVFMGVYGFVPPPTIFFLPVILFLLFVFCLGLAIPFSVLNVHFRDFRSIWTIALQALFFLTPVFYKLDFLPAPIRYVMQYSPLAQIMTMAREVALENKLPDASWFSYVVFSVFITFALGLLVFNRYKINLVEKV